MIFGRSVTFRVQIAHSQPRRIIGFLSARYRLFSPPLTRPCSPLPIVKLTCSKRNGVMSGFDGEYLPWQLFLKQAQSTKTEFHFYIALLIQNTMSIVFRMSANIWIFTYSGMGTSNGLLVSHIVGTVVNCSLVYLGINVTGVVLFACRRYAEGGGSEQAPARPAEAGWGVRVSLERAAVDRSSMRRGRHSLCLPRLRRWQETRPGGGWQVGSGARAGRLAGPTLIHWSLCYLVDAHARTSKDDCSNGRIFNLSLSTFLLELKNESAWDLVNLALLCEWKISRQMVSESGTDSYM
jgi:hypothetical protein